MTDPFAFSNKASASPAKAIKSPRLKKAAAGGKGGGKVLANSYGTKAKKATPTKSPKATKATKAATAKATKAKAAEAAKATKATKALKAAVKAKPTSTKKAPKSPVKSKKSIEEKAPTTPKSKTRKAAFTPEKGSALWNLVQASPSTMSKKEIIATEKAKKKVVEQKATPKKGGKRKAPVKKAATSKRVKKPVTPLPPKDYAVGDYAYIWDAESGKPWRGKLLEVTQGDEDEEAEVGQTTIWKLHFGDGDYEYDEDELFRERKLCVTAHVTA